MPSSELNKANDAPDIEVIPGADIEIIPGAGEPTAIPLERDLSLQIQSVQEAGAPDERRFRDYFSPEVTAGIVISLLFAIFAALMLIGVSDSEDAPSDDDPAVSTPAPVAPAEDVTVEIGEGITLERE